MLYMLVIVFSSLKTNVEHALPDYQKEQNAYTGEAYEGVQKIK